MLLIIANYQYYYDCYCYCQCCYYMIIIMKMCFIFYDCCFFNVINDVIVFGYVFVLINQSESLRLKAIFFSCLENMYPIFCFISFVIFQSSSCT